MGPSHHSRGTNANQPPPTHQPPHRHPRSTTHQRSLPKTGPDAHAARPADDQATASPAATHDQPYEPSLLPLQLLTLETLRRPIESTQYLSIRYTNRLTVGRLSRRLLRQRPRRICHRPLQDRTHPPEGTMARPGPGRVRHPRVRRLVQPPKTPRTNRTHPTSRKGGQLPSSTKASPASWTQIKHPPANPERFTPQGTNQHPFTWIAQHPPRCPGIPNSRVRMVRP